MMTTKERTQQEKLQAILAGLLREDDNKYCVDCDGKGPRWASWNIGIFLCIRCAGIHRNLGVHVSKVKSVNLDAWAPEQVAMMQEMGNSKARAVYEAKLPDHFKRPQNDQALEQFIRSKYEHRRYLADEWVPPKLKVPNLDEPAVKETKKRPRQKVSLNTKSVTKPTVKNPPKDIPTPNDTRNPTPSIQAQVDLLGLDIGNNSEPQKMDVTPSGKDDLLGSLAPGNAPQVTHNEANSVQYLVPAPISLSFVSLQPTTLANQTKAQQHVSQSMADLQTLDMSAPQQQTSMSSVSSEPNLLDVSGSSGGKVNKDSIMALYGSQQQQQPTHQNNPTVAGGGYAAVPGFPPPQPQPGMVGPGGVAMGGMPGYQSYMVTGAQQHAAAMQQMNQYQQQQMYYQQFQQTQQQLMNMQIGGMPAVPAHHMRQANPAVPPTAQAAPLQQAVPATGNWNTASQGHTLSNQLWQ